MGYSEPVSRKVNTYGDRTAKTDGEKTTTKMRNGKKIVLAKINDAKFRTQMLFLAKLHLTKLTKF